MLRTVSPLGTEMLVPESREEDQAYFTLDEIESACDYYRQEGYVVLRGLIARERCDAVIKGFNARARHSPVPILRQKNMQYERNQFDGNGLLSNPIFNIQDLEDRHFGEFRQAALDLYTDSNVLRAVSAVLGQPNGNAVRLVESMFFEAPAGTWPHQDSYYQDSAAHLGGATAGWFAMEDIDPSAGRFYICPRSHRGVPIVMNRGPQNFGTGHDSYREAILAVARDHGLQWRAPYMAAGDVLLWNSLTIHGSLPGRAGSAASRRSLTAHFLRSEDQLLQFHSRVRVQKLTHHRNVEIGLLHDQNEIRNRMVRTLAYHFPNAWRFARRVAIRALVHANKNRPQVTASAASPLESGVPTVE